LAVVDGVAKLNTIAGPPGTLSTRVGISSGLVVVGDLIGFGSSLESAAVGDTPNLASRLQTIAEPGTVVASESTRHLTGDLFEYRELSLRELKGRRTPERAWVVLCESAIDSRFEALRGGQLSLVGRAEQLELLLRRWEEAKAGKGRVVLLGGEPGIGKSHLVSALEQQVGPARHLRLRFLCSPHHHNTPLHPVVRQMERAAKFERGDSPAAKWDKLTSLLSPSASSEDIALLADLLSITHSITDLLKTFGPQRRKSMTFAAIVRNMDNLARRTPILGIFEDLHWADATTLDLLDLLIRSIQTMPILLVITARPEVQPAWVARPYVTVQILSQLDRSMAISLIKQVAGDRDLPGQVIDRILSHADGVPLFIEELTKTVLQRGSEHDGKRPLPMQSLSADLVPTSLHASLMARLDQIPIGKEVAQIGAVIGREFSFEALQVLSMLPAKQLEHALDELAHAGIITTRGQPPFATHTFKHALVQDAAYASLLRARRHAIHLRLAEGLENDTADAAAEYQLIAWHFAEASAPDKSITYYSKAAEHATGRFALAEIVGHLRNALRQVTHLPESMEKQRRELALQVALGRALIDHQGSASEDVRATFERARELCLALDELQLLPRVYDGLMLNYHFTHCQPHKMIGYASEMVEVYQRTGDRQALLMARRAGGLANLLLGHFEQAREEMQLVIDMYDAEYDGPHAGTSTRDPKVSICTVLGICLTALGYPESGAAVSWTGIQHAETLNHSISLILGLRRACVQGILERDVQRVTELSRRLLAMGAAYETFKGSREGMVFRDWAQLRTRPEREIFDRIRASLHQIDITMNWAFLSFYMTSVAELIGEYGDVGTAVALLERAAELVSITGERWCEAEIMRLQARFSARDPAESVALLRASLAKAREQGAKLWELRTATSLAEFWRDQGDRTAAREVLAPIYQWFTEGRNTTDLIAARSLLEQVGRA
jgi:hypothetical protein